MALVNGELEQDYPREQQGGFLDGLLGALKWVAIIAVTLTGLGALFKYSDTARGALDGITGGKGKGWGSAASKAWDDTAGKLFARKNDIISANYSVAPGDISATTKTSKGELLVPQKEAFAVSNEQSFAQLKDYSAELDRIATMPDENIRKSFLEDLKGTRDSALLIGRKVEEWNKLAIAHKSTATDAPQALLIPLDIPPLTPELEQYGVGIVGSKQEWNKLTPLVKLTKIADYVEKQLESPPDLKKLNYEDSFFLDSAEHNYKHDIERLIEQKRYKDAVRYAELARDTHRDQKGWIFPSEDKKDIALANKTADEFERMIPYLNALDKNDALISHRDKALKAIQTVIEGAPDSPALNTRIDNYLVSVEQYKAKAVTPPPAAPAAAPATTTDPAAVAAAQAQAKTAVPTPAGVGGGQTATTPAAPVVAVVPPKAPGTPTKAAVGGP
jgi:hypothetical protein